MERVAHVPRRPSPYDRLFDGQLYEVTLADYPRLKSPASLASAILSAALYRGIRAKVQRRGDKVYVQVPITTNNPEA